MFQESKSDKQQHFKSFKGGKHFWSLFSTEGKLLVKHLSRVPITVTLCQSNIRFLATASNMKVLVPVSALRMGLLSLFFRYFMADFKI